MPGFEQREKLVVPENQDILVVGNGYVGEKAQQFIKKTKILREIGFRTPHRTVLAQDFFDDFFRENNLGNSLTEVSQDKSVVNLITSGDFTQKQTETLHKLCQRYGDNPIVIRSSAAGDAKGTGIYESVVTVNEPESVQKALRTVLGSYFTQSAINFRRDAKTGEGMGVIIEPLVGQKDKIGNFYPLLSGHGYTSTLSGEGYIMVAPGFGCAVQSRFGEKITRSAMESYDGSLIDYSLKERRLMIDGINSVRTSALLGLDEGLSRWNVDVVRGATFCDGEILESTSIRCNFESIFGKSLLGVNLLEFFEKLENMETRFAKPQYIEWAMTFESGKPNFWIVQVADIDKKVCFIDFGNSEDILFEGHDVEGTGVKNVSKIVFPMNPDDISHLKDFDKTNKDYVLILPGRLISGIFDIDYSDIKNAAVILEKQESYHGESSSSHFKGRLGMTGKFFGVLNTGEVNRWELFRSCQKENNLSVYFGKLKVIASEKEDRIVISLDEDEKEE